MTYLKNKKLTFMSIVNSVKGFVRSVLGISPLTLPDCVDEDSLINYTISGNSVQNGTLTPENPIEVESVGDYYKETGKYTIPVVCSGKNILNPDLFGYYKGNVEGLYGKWTFIKANTTYKFSIKKIMGCTTYRINCALFDTNKQLIQNKSGAIAYNYPISFSANTGVGWYWAASHILSMNQDRTELNNLVITFKPSRDMYIAWYLTGGTVTSSCYALEPQIEEGTAKTDYEPYVEPVTTNIYVEKPLADGETLKNPVKLPTVKGTTIYTIGTGVQPKNISATYYSTRKD